MERREFLKIFAGVAAGAAALAATAQAAPLMPQPLNEDAKLPQNPDAQPAVTSGDEVDRLQPEEVRWGRGRLAAGAAGTGAGAVAGSGATAAVTGAAAAGGAITVAGIGAAATGAAVTGEHNPVTGSPYFSR